MWFKAFRSALTFFSLSSLSSCGQYLDSGGLSDSSKQYEVCKAKLKDGGVSDNCVSEILEDGSCPNGRVKVKSEKPADEYSCLVEL